jgi:hypothetical protein
MFDNDTIHRFIQFCKTRIIFYISIIAIIIGVCIAHTRITYYIYSVIVIILFLLYKKFQNKID